jgi:hypothetical protein
MREFEIIPGLITAWKLLVLPMKVRLGIEELSLLGCSLLKVSRRFGGTILLSCDLKNDPGMKSA